MTKKIEGLRNEWTFGGELIYVKEQEGEFGASIKIRGVSQRRYSEVVQILEVACLVPYEVYEDFIDRDVQPYDNVIVSGHIETWQKVKSNGKVSVKQMFVVDYLLDVTKK